jgi:beta-xylosidase
VRWLVIAASAATIALTVTVSLDGRPTTAAIPRLPTLGPSQDVFDGDIGDPFVLPVPAGPARAAGYWMFGTNDRPAHVPTGFSADLIHWQRGPDALPALPRWAAQDPTNSLVWAPAVLATATGYIMYVAVPDAATGHECIAAEASPVPQGPYHDTASGPLVCQVHLGGSIDPMIVRDGDGRLHLLWKNDGNCCQLPVSMWQQDLASNGLHLAGQPHRLLGADQPWEAGVIERPVALPTAHGGWWLFHAGNNWQSATYGTGLAYCRTLTGPCRNATPGPFLATNGNQYSPGGLDTFIDLHGTRWVVYAIWNRPPRNGRFYCCRSVELARLVNW